MRFSSSRWGSSGRVQAQTLPGTLLVLKGIKIPYPVIARAGAPALFAGREAGVVLGCSRGVRVPISALPEAFHVALVGNLK